MEHKIVSEAHQSRSVMAIELIRYSIELTKIKIITNDEPVIATLQVLALHSDVLACIAELKLDGEIEIKHSSEAIKSVIDWMYTDEEYECDNKSIALLYDVLRFCVAYNIMPIAKAVTSACLAKDTYADCIDILKLCKNDAVDKVIYATCIQKMANMHHVLSIPITCHDDKRNSDKRQLCCLHGTTIGGKHVRVNSEDAKEDATKTHYCYKIAGTQPIIQSVIRVYNTKWCCAHRINNECYKMHHQRRVVLYRQYVKMLPMNIRDDIDEAILAWRESL